MESVLLNTIFIFVCLAFSAFFSATETALFSLKRSDLHNFTFSDKKDERLIAAMMKSPQKVLITLLTGNLFVNIGASAILTELLLRYFGHYGHIIAIAIVTPLIIIFCEISPKVIAINSPSVISKKNVFILNIIEFLVYPVREALLKITNLLVRIFKIETERKASITENELSEAVKMSEKDGYLDPSEGLFIKNVLKFSKKDASNVMIPRNKAVAIPYGSTIEAAKRVFCESGVVRAPVYQKDIDNIVGLIDSRDLLPYHVGYKSAKSINKLVQPITYYPSSLELGELLKDFLVKKIQIAVIIDEYGGTAGIVTLSSIISEVLGEGFESSGIKKKNEIRVVDSKTKIISGDMQLYDFNYEFDDELSSDDADTVGGYLIEQLGHIPSRGDEIFTNRYGFKIRNVQKSKIISVEVTTLDI